MKEYLLRTDELWDLFATVPRFHPEKVWEKEKNSYLVGY